MCPQCPVCGIVRGRSTAGGVCVRARTRVHTKDYEDEDGSSRRCTLYFFTIERDQPYNPVYLVDTWEEGDILCYSLSRSNSSRPINIAS